jgi:hypothetical protein
MTPLPPSPWIERWAHLIAPGGSVLDVAAGRRSAHDLARGARPRRHRGRPRRRGDGALNGIARSSSPTSRPRRGR